MEPAQPAICGILRFGIFELDPAAGELRRNGSLIRLPPQPFQVLQLLVRNAGQVIDRDRIRQEVWGETVVDFDRSLNVCIAQIRAVLKDDADSPTFIQTLPRRGYRFLAPVAGSTALTPAAPVPPAGPPASLIRARLPLVLASCLVVALAAVGYRWTQSPEQTIRLAVLPFEVVGSRPDSPQADGIFDDLLTRLGGVQPDRLRVIGRRSVAVFANERKSLREIGNRLNVLYVLETTVRVEEARLRIAVRLAQTDNESVLWSETFAQDADSRAFEERVVARVSAAVLAKLFPGAPTPVEDSSCRQGWESYRTGRQLANRGNLASLERSLPYFEQASCAASRAALAETLVRIAKIGPHPPEFWERARTAARAALQPDPGIAGAHLSLGNIAFWHDWDWKTAAREFQIALRRNPSDPDAHHDLAWLMVAMGRRPEAIASLQRAIALDPLSARTSIDAAWLLLQAGRFRESAAQARRSLELDPDLQEANACLYRALLYAGDDLQALEVMRTNFPPEEVNSIAGLPPAEATRRLLDLSVRGTRPIDPYQRAWRLAWIGSREQALTALEEAFQKRVMMMPLIAVDPGFAAIRNETRFQKIVREMGL